ncbi:MAG: hypothetical protein C0501_06295 [Isosphaera sp.]|nr:hypothetical protein [Isosphaera sp.]
MSMTPCPGCGLPREEALVGTAPCPVCASNTAPAAVALPPAPDRPDPTAGLPADAGEFDRHRDARPGAPRGRVWAAVFLVGAAAGVGGVAGWRAAFPPAPRVVRAEPPAPPPPVPDLPARPPQVEVAPPPREPGPAVAPDPRAVQVIHTPGLVTMIFDDPEQTYTVPTATKKGVKYVLKGRLKSLTVYGMDAGDVVDASGLQAATVSVAGRVAGGSVLKVNAPGGAVMVHAQVGEKAVLDLHAPGGEVRTHYATTEAKPGSRIDGGAQVTITARTVDLKGDVNGVDTKVTVHLQPTGSLKVAAVRGTATVEYRVTEGKGKPDVTAGFVAPTATFRRVE